MPLPDFGNDDAPKLPDFGSASNLPDFGSGQKKSREQIQAEIESRSDNDGAAKTALLKAAAWLGTSDYSPVVALGNAPRNLINLPANAEKVVGLLPKDTPAPAESNTPLLPIPSITPDTVNTVAQKIGCWVFIVH